MNHDTTLTYIQSKLEGRRKELQEFIATGSINDLAEYKKVCGVIQGLDFVENVIADLAQRLETDADE